MTAGEYLPLMLRPFRSPLLAWLALVAFLVAQPMVGCAVLCLDAHHGHGDRGGTAASTAPVSCHAEIGPAIHHGPAQTLSSMEPAGEPAPVRLIALTVRAAAPRPTTPAHHSPGLDPPPPRLA